MQYSSCLCDSGRDPFFERSSCLPPSRTPTVRLFLRQFCKFILRTHFFFVGRIVHTFFPACPSPLLSTIRLPPFFLARRPPWTRFLFYDNSGALSLLLYCGAFGVLLFLSEQLNFLYPAELRNLVSWSFSPRSLFRPLHTFLYFAHQTERGCVFTVPFLSLFFPDSVDGRFFCDREYPQRFPFARGELL